MLKSKMIIIITVKPAILFAEMNMLEPLWDTHVTLTIPAKRDR